MARVSDNPPVQLGDAAAGNLRYIRATMDASGAFTRVSGSGTVAVGVIGTSAGLAAVIIPLGDRWPLLWLTAAAIAAPLGCIQLARKTGQSGISLTSGIGQRFVFALLPGFIAAALLTWALLGAGVLSLLPASWLLLYGASVSAASALSVPAVRLLGITCMALGGLALLAPVSWGQVLLLTGFGIAHMGFGAWIWQQHGG